MKLTKTNIVLRTFEANAQKVVKQCVRITSDDSNRCINCGAMTGHKCEINNETNKD